MLDSILVITLNYGTIYACRTGSPTNRKKKKNTVAVMYTYKGISWHVTSCKHYNIDSSLARAVLLKNSRNEHSITRFDMEHRGALL